MSPGNPCRACGAPLRVTMIDLGEMPLANSYLRAEEVEREERRYPLRVSVCEECLLAQLDTPVDAVDLFSDYAYFSSYSESWLAHAARFAEKAILRFGLSASSHVLEVASNDGYLLTNFVERGIPSLGVEPAANVAAVAVARGVPTRVAFFTRSTAEALAAEGHRSTLVVANNVLAHVPDANDLLRGVALVLAPGGVASFEFPHLLRLLEDCQFDTIYHEHYSYFSMLAVERLFARNGLEVFDVEELPTHGGSLRVYAQHRGGPHPRTRTPDAVCEREIAAGLDRPETYGRLAERAERIRRALVGFLRQARQEGKRVVAYGAPAKGNTLLNFCGVGPDLIVATADRSPHKQGRYLPGTHIPVLTPAILPELRPDYVLILPWNLREEIMQQLSWMTAYGGQFVLAIPELRMLAPLCGFTLRTS